MTACKKMTTIQEMLDDKTSPIYHAICTTTSVIVLLSSILCARSLPIACAAATSTVYHSWRTFSRVNNSTAYKSRLFKTDLLFSVTVCVCLFYTFRPMRLLLLLCATMSMASWTCTNCFMSQPCHMTTHILLGSFALFYTYFKRYRDKDSFKT